MRLFLGTFIHPLFCSFSWSNWPLIQTIFIEWYAWRRCVNWVRRTSAIRRCCPRVSSPPSLSLVLMLFPTSVSRWGYWITRFFCSYVKALNTTRLLFIAKPHKRTQNDSPMHFVSLIASQNASYYASILSFYCLHLSFSKTALSGQAAGQKSLRA